MTCTSSQIRPDHVPLASFLVPAVVGGLLLVLAVPLGFIYWRRLAGDLATYKQIWHKRRYLSACFLAGMYNRGSFLGCYPWPGAFCKNGSHGHV